MAERLTGIESRLIALHADYKKTMLGNGQPGLVTRMARVETRLMILWSLAVPALGLSGFGLWQIFA